MFRVILRQHAAWMEHNFAFNEMLLNVYRMFEGPIDLKMYVLKHLICDV